MLCILCTSSSDQMLNIFDENGINLNISKIITKHFWLQPNAEVNNARAICNFCWNTVESFHKFYKSIEEAHTKLTAIIKLPDKESDNESTHFEIFQDLFTTVVKQENSEDTTKVELPDSPETAQPIETETKNAEHHEFLNSDSESEVPLGKFYNRKNFLKDDNYDEIKDNDTDSEDSSSAQDNDNQQQDFNSDTDSDYNAPKKKAKVKVSSTTKELGKNRIPCKEFDSFIKKNMELSCSLCTEPLENFFCLKEHFKKIHKTEGFVTCCDKQWTSRFSLVHHLLLHQDPDLYKCKKCGRILANKRSFKNHMQSHVTQERIHQCTKCKKKFSSIPKLEKHLKSHIRIQTDQICEQCGKVCHSKQSLSAHQKREHMGFVKQRVQCTKCGAHLSDASTLHFHMKYQHPKTKVINACNICGKISATAYGLKRHIQYMHTMERVHKCTICEDKAFKTAQILRVGAILSAKKELLTENHPYVKSIQENNFHHLLKKKKKEQKKSSIE